MRNELNLDFKTTGDLGAEPEFARKLFSLLSRGDYLPTHYSEYEPINTPWDCSESGEAAFVGKWLEQATVPVGDLLIRRRKRPSYTMMVVQPRGRHSKGQYLSLFSYSYSHLTKPDARQSFLALADELFGSLSMVYGRICLAEDFESKNIIKDYEHADGSVEPRRPVGIDWTECLPGIYWQNYFGREYVDWIGRDRLLNVPVGSVTGLGDAIRVETYPEATDCRTDAGKRAERALRNYLGSSRFFDRHDIPRQYQAPRLDFSEILRLA